MTHKLSIEEMQVIAKKRGGACLSDTYAGNKTKLKWRCAKGHEWRSNPDHIKRGQWCPICAGIIPLTIQEMQKLVEVKGGKCLSPKYVNARTKLKWQCAKGHEWEANPDHVKRGQWCLICAGRQRLTLADMQNFAAKYSGKCLSKKYISSKNNLRWQCDKGHEWEANAEHIKRGQWCPECAGRRPSIAEMQKIAISRGGKCLSKKYIRSTSKLRWQCTRGHIWEAMPGNIKQGQWCPECINSTSEDICRKFFERIFNRKFPKRRFSWLTNSRGNRMELDGYCEGLKLAFEYNGKQHYREALFHREQDSLRRRIEDDEKKKRLCNKYGISLIVVSYKVSFAKMYEYIIQSCRRRNIDIPSHQRPNYKDFNLYKTDKISELNQIAITRSGKCLSNNYINETDPLKWQCKFGHEWNASANTVRQGHWCLICSGRQKLTMVDMKETATEHDGKCLSSNYVNAGTKLLWQCAKRHEWEATPNHVRQGHWCPTCAREKVKNK